MDEPLWTVEQLADYLTVPKATLYNWRCQNKGPASIKVGKYLRYRRSEVEKWLETLTSP